MPRWVAALRLIGVGFYIGGCILLGIIGGLWLDNRLSARPIFMIVGLIVGILLAFYGVYQMLRPIMNGRRDKENG